MSWSWGVAKKISKLPSRRGLQKNHAQLHNFPGKSLVKFSRRQNFKIIWKVHEFRSEQTESSPNSVFFFARETAKVGEKQFFGLILTFFLGKNRLSRPLFPAFLALFSPIFEFLAHSFLKFFSGWKDGFSGTILRCFSFLYTVLKFGQAGDPDEKN